MQVVWPPPSPLRCLWVGISLHLQSQFQIFHQVWIIDSIFVDIPQKYFNILPNMHLIYYCVLNSKILNLILMCFFNFLYNNPNIKLSQGKSVENLENWKTIPTDPTFSSVKPNIIDQMESLMNKAKMLANSGERFF